MALYEDSHLRCPLCSKRMLVELGPDDGGRLDVRHECWNCDYTTREPRQVGADVVRVLTGIRGERAAKAETLTFDGETFIGGAP